MNCEQMKICLWITILMLFVVEISAAYFGSQIAAGNCATCVIERIYERIL